MMATKCKKAYVKTHFVDHLGNSHLNVETFPSETSDSFKAMKFIKSLLGHGALGMFGVNILCRNKMLECDVVFQSSGYCGRDDF